MGDGKVRTFAELHERLQPFRQPGRQWIFRGQASAKWKLVPKAGRENWWNDHEFDLAIFESWCSRAVEFASGLAESEWDWLATAQHHGLATRLLDWSLSPLAAAFFAVCEDKGDDAAIYALSPSIRYVNPHDEDVRSVPAIAVYTPRGVAHRISRQTSVFTVHNPPSLPIDEVTVGGALHTILIAKEARVRLLRELDFYNMNRFTLFPDLDGLSAHLNWLTSPDLEPGCLDPREKETSEVIPEADEQ